MLVNNYYLIQSYFAKNGYINGAQGVSLPGTKSITGDTQLIYVGYAYSSTMNKNGSPRADLSIRLGTGDTPPELTDYCLETDISSSLNLSCAVNTGAENGAIKTVLTVSGTNSSASEVTLKEFAIIKQIRGNDSPSTTIEYMIARGLLNEPKVVGAGEPFTITFEWSGS